MVSTKCNFKKLLRVKMVECDINTFKDLAKMTGIDYQRLRARLDDPGSLRIFELRALKKVLDLEDSDILTVIGD